MDLEAIEKVYRRYAPSYDFYFGAVLQPGRRKVIERMNCRPGQRILEVGVGTGLSLSLYPRDVHVTGIDVSREMLARAHDRVAAMHLDNVTLHCMDAEGMTFPDDSFDKVVAMYVVSVVPSPGRLVAEMRRVCKPGANLYVVNHFRQSNPVVSMLERMMAPFSRLVGFHPDFSLEHFVEQTGFTAAEQIPVNLFGYWTLLRARNDKGAQPPSPPTVAI